ncbi:acyl-CoA Delta(11) desaturase [Manduca sexta]|uniref:acyl-CoA Delta(11) desaturase n=1 Tax=Manduca sexta TaxID=7130 RepID=UPI00188DCF05|nr:acyl-CoA Delta(11) desaturase [Manduca sexta]
MAPNTTNENTITPESDMLEKLIVPRAEPRKYKIVCRNIVVFLYYHFAGLYGFYLCLTAAKWQTILAGYIFFIVGGLGITAGSHRLWSHKSFKATKPLQLILMLFQSCANQHSVAHWVRDHRLHHKYSDTDADPHNATRGFFYSHVGWLMVRKHPEVVKRGKHIDLSDIYSNPYLKFQNDNSFWFIPLLSFVVPTLLPVICWSETISIAWHVNMLRYALNLNVTFMVNSVAHMWGYKPYDKNIAPSQSHAVSVVSLGEGYHNFHHVFPYDYRSDELSNIRLNPTTIFIDLCAKLGLAYDLKRAPREIVTARAKRTGDGTME